MPQNDPKHDPAHPSKDDERSRQPQPGRGSAPHSGDKSRGGKDNPGNFGNDPDRARKSGEKGGHSHS
jgi:general stress protein YciG